MRHCRVIPWMVLLLVSAAGPALAGDKTGDSQPRLWPDTGHVSQGHAQAKTEGMVAPEHYGDTDEATVEQLNYLRERMKNGPQHPEGPELKWVEPVPEGGTPSSPPTEPGRAAGDFVMKTNTEPTSVVPGGYSSTTNEPSTVSAGPTVVYTGNWYAAISTDRGQTFTFVNPFTAPAAPAGDGFCCDQTTVYDPKTNTIVWLQQYLDDGTTGVHRLNIDKGADGVFDCYYDFTPQDYGFPTNNFFDFPDLALSNDNLFHASNVFSTTNGSFTGGVVARMPMSALSTCSGFGFSYYSDAGFGSFRLARGATTTMYFASPISNSSMRIWSWADGSGTLNINDRTVTTWSDATRVCPGPDGRDWCGFIDRRIQGAWVANGIVGFMWVPAQDGSYSYPYTRIAEFNEGDLSLASEPTVYSGSIAWVYPSVDVNANGDLGGSIMFGGGANYPGCAVWLSDDVNGGTLAPLEYQVGAFGSSGPSTNRSGDYNVSHVNTPNGYTYSGACFSYPNTTEAQAQYMRFGRQENLAIFTDPFESGNSTAWTVTQP